MKCYDSASLELKNEIYNTGFQSVMLNFEECNDYESETFCASEEEVATYWATERPAILILMIIKQVDMTDIDNPV